MANGKLTLGKQSGGTLGLVFPDGVSNTEVVLPESGNLVSVDIAVTDNAVARYDGTTGKLQDSSVTINDSGSLIIGESNIAPLLIFNRGTDGLSLGYLGNPSNSSVDLNLINSSGTGNLNLGAGTNANVNIVSGNLLLTSGTGALGYGTGAGGTVTQLTSKSTAVTLNKPCGRIILVKDSLASGATVYFILNNSLITAGDTIVVNNNNYGAYIVQCRLVNTGVAYIYITNTGSTQSETFSVYFSIIKGATE